jgi:hypothetical protein
LALFLVGDDNSHDTDVDVGGLFPSVNPFFPDFWFSVSSFFFASHRFRMESNGFLAVNMVDEDRRGGEPLMRDGVSPPCGDKKLVARGNANMTTQIFVPAFPINCILVILLFTVKSKWTWLGKMTTIYRNVYVFV